MKDFNIIPGLKVKILDKDVLIKLGYEPEESDDFFHKIAGKEIVIEQVFDKHAIYTCKEFPDVAIYKVFIEKIVFEEDENLFTFQNIGRILNISRETVRRNYNSAKIKIYNVVSTNSDFDEYKI